VFRNIFRHEIRCVIFRVNFFYLVFAGFTIFLKYLINLDIIIFQEKFFFFWKRFNIIIFNGDFFLSIIFKKFNRILKKLRTEI